MAILNIEDVPDPLCERLKRQARAEGRSVSREVIRLLEATVAAHADLHSLQGHGARALALLDH